VKRIAEGVLAVFLFVGLAYGQAINPPECTNAQYDANGRILNLFGCGVPSAPVPVPTSQPPFQPPPAAGCTDGNLLNMPLGGGNYGVTTVAIPEGYTHTYCATLQNAKQWMRFEQSDKCIGTAVMLRFTPPPGAVYATGGSIPVIDQRQTINITAGRNAPLNYVPAGTYYIQVIGGHPGNMCNGINQYDLIWKFG
jgi:hypothetical protein